MTFAMNIVKKIAMFAVLLVLSCALNINCKSAHRIAGAESLQSHVYKWSYVVQDTPQNKTVALHPVATIRTVSEKVQDNAENINRQGEILDKLTQSLQKSDAMQALISRLDSRSDSLQQAIKRLEVQNREKDLKLAQANLRAEMQDRTNKTMIGIVKYFPCVTAILCIIVGTIFYFWGKNDGRKSMFVELDS